MQISEEFYIHNVTEKPLFKTFSQKEFPTLNTFATKDNLYWSKLPHLAQSC